MLSFKDVSDYYDLSDDEVSMMLTLLEKSAAEGSFKRSTQQEPTSENPQEAHH